MRGTGPFQKRRTRAGHTYDEDGCVAVVAVRGKLFERLAGNLTFY